MLEKALNFFERAQQRIKMNSTIYQLKINADTKQQAHLNVIFDSMVTISSGTTWTLEYELFDGGPWIDHLEHFVKLIQQNASDIEKLGIHGSDISVWIIAEYSTQFNTEFSPNILKSLGELGLTLCISAYEITQNE